MQSVWVDETGGYRDRKSQILTNPLRVFLCLLRLLNNMATSYTCLNHFVGSPPSSAKGKTKQNTSSLVYLFTVSSLLLWLIPFMNWLLPLCVHWCRTSLVHFPFERLLRSCKHGGAFQALQLLMDWWGRQGCITRNNVLWEHCREQRVKRKGEGDSELAKGTASLLMVGSVLLRYSLEAWSDGFSRRENSTIEAVGTPSRRPSDGSPQHDQGMMAILRQLK